MLSSEEFAEERSVVDNLVVVIGESTRSWNSFLVFLRGIFFVNTLLLCSRRRGGDSAFVSEFRESLVFFQGLD